MVTPKGRDFMPYPPCLDFLKLVLRVGYLRLILSYRLLVSMIDKPLKELVGVAHRVC